jgi:hypothetical protein
MTNTYNTKQLNTNLPNNSITTTQNFGSTTANTNFLNASSTPILTILRGEDTVRVEENATLSIEGKVKINGEYLDERLERIETLLHIPIRDVTMEQKYSRLKTLWQEYNQELEKYKIWETLKGN